MGIYVLGFEEIDRTQTPRIGGKGAHLAELSRMEGVSIPDGFCVTTEAFRRVRGEAATIDEQLDRLARLSPEDGDTIGTLTGMIRDTLQAVTIPDDLAAAITGAATRLGGPTAAYAVRSSATAEDQPTASFAGQHDTFLNVVGSAAILHHVSRCWASLFTERAVIYRLRNGIDHRLVEMAVVVQRMVVPQSSGVLFTADPVTSNRKVASVEATFGLGEALVSGRVNPDVYRVRGGEIVAKSVATKQLARQAAPGGGTEEVVIERARQDQPALTDDQVLEVVRVGRRIEAHFGRPQDIEWVLVDRVFQLVQARPITTLFPVPTAGDDAHHVYVSVGHQQMMTDPMKPLGLSFWQLTTRRPMFEAGGRLFVDVAQALGSPATRPGMLEGLGRSDPLIGDALQTIVDRGDFIPMLPDEGPGAPAVGGVPGTGGPEPLETDPAIATGLIQHSQDSIAKLQADIATQSGPALVDFISADLEELQRNLFDPRSTQVIMAGMEATWWLNDQLEVWLGEKNAADVLSQSAPGNVTSEMGLALLDVADVMRPHPEVVAFLERVMDHHRHGHEVENFLGELATLTGGQEALDVLRSFLGRYGMRCVGEIDITRPRWSERPTTLVPLLLSNIRNFEAGAAARRFELGRAEAERSERDVLARLAALPEGEQKADEAREMIGRVRAFSGYREYPKYGMVSRYFIYKLALLEEAERLVRSHVLAQPDDIFYLRLDEVRDVVRRHRVDGQLISRRREQFLSYRALTPPRVSTSDGEVITGAYRRHGVPSGSLVGLPVSTGTAEGRARVVLELGEIDLEAGDILVTAFTDPSWTPAFVAIAGLVTEVGGLMTHGAVIAREYGVPAVVGVEDCTRLILDRQRIRVDGTNGTVEILSPADQVR